MWLTNQQIQHLRRGYQKNIESPVPTQVISSGECFPPPQTRQQVQVESLIQENAQVYARRQGLERQSYLRSRSGMASAFLAMNQVFGKSTTLTPPKPKISLPRVNGMTKLQISLSSMSIPIMYTTITVGRAYFGYVTPPVETTKQRNRGTRILSNWISISNITSSTTISRTCSSIAIPRLPC